MDRSRSYSRPSPSDNPRSTSPSTPRSTMASRGRPAKSLPSSHHGSRSRSSSKSTSRSPSRRAHHHKPQHEHHQDHQHHGLFKTSASLIAGIGLATVLAHKVWPKGVAHGDEDDWESSPRSKHHQHHHHHSSDHHRRHSSDVERIVDHARSSHGRGDVLYVEEVGPFRRSDDWRKSLGPRSFERLERTSDERILREARSPRDERVRPAVLPYPETPYPDAKFYGPSRRRAPAPEPIPVSR